MNAVEDPKSSADSAAKSIALDHLGDIAARIRGLHAQMANNVVPTLEEIVSKADSEGAKALLRAHKLVDSCLTASAEEDDMYSVSHISFTGIRLIVVRKGYGLCCMGSGIAWHHHQGGLGGRETCSGDGGRCSGREGEITGDLPDIQICFEGCLASGR